MLLRNDVIVADEWGTDRVILVNHRGFTLTFVATVNITVHGNQAAERRQTRLRLPRFIHHAWNLAALAETSVQAGVLPEKLW